MKAPIEVERDIYCAPIVIFSDIRESLLALSEKLFSIEEKFKGELGSEARVIWLFAHEQDPRNAREVRALLTDISSLLGFLENWSECARAGSPSKDEDWNVIHEADAAAERTRVALHALVDHLRTAK